MLDKVLCLWRFGPAPRFRQPLTFALVSEINSQWNKAGAAPADTDPGSKPCQEEQSGAMPSPAEVAELFIDVCVFAGWGEEGICLQRESRFCSGFTYLKLICSSLWPDCIRRISFLFFFSPMEYWIYYCLNIKMFLACFQHMVVYFVSYGHVLYGWFRLCLKNTADFKGKPFPGWMQLI